MKLVTLKSWQGKYMSAQPDGSLQVNRDDALEWEHFTVEDVAQPVQPPATGHKVVALKSAHGYLSAQLDGTLRCDRAVVGPWEQFEVPLDF